MIKNRVRLKAIHFLLLFLFSVLQLKEFYKNSKLLKLPKKIDQHFKVKKKRLIEFNLFSMRLMLLIRRDNY